MITSIICLSYYILCYNKNAERGMICFSVAALYSAFMLSMMNFYYSRYNFIFFLISSITSMMFSMNMIWVPLGGLLGTLISYLIFLLIHKKNVDKDL